MISLCAQTIQKSIGKARSIINILSFDCWFYVIMLSWRLTTNGYKYILHHQLVCEGLLLVMYGQEYGLWYKTVSCVRKPTQLTGSTIRPWKSWLIHDWTIRGGFPFFRKLVYFQRFPPCQSHLSFSSLLKISSPVC